MNIHQKIYKNGGKYTASWYICVNWLKMGFFIYIMLENFV